MSVFPLSTIFETDRHSPTAIWSGDFRHWNEKSLGDNSKTARFQEVSVKHETALENIALTKAETGERVSNRPS